MMPADLPSLGFRVLFLRGKHPVSRNGHHWVTTDPDEIRRHRGNVGIMAGTHVVLDFDLVGAMAEMVAALGPIQPTVETGSGKLHCYAAHVPGLPRYFSWAGVKVGEIVRLPTEYSVCPPSIHPKTGLPYRWLVDPREPFPPLPEAWLAHLGTQTVPERNTTRTEGKDTTWDGPEAEELLRLAMEQPGGQRRSTGVKFQCPGCRDEGHDRHMDNACVFLDGRWGCAVNANHRGAIAEALGVIVNIPDVEPQGTDVARLRALDLDADWTGNS